MRAPVLVVLALVASLAPPAGAARRQEQIAFTSDRTGFAQVYPRSGKAPFPIPNYIKGSK